MTCRSIIESGVWPRTCSWTGAARSAVARPLAARLVTREALALFASERGRWPGVRQLDKVLVVCDEGAESPMATRLRLVLIAGRLPWPVTQYRGQRPARRGWTVLRFGAADVYRRPRHVIATVRAALTTPTPG